MEIRLTHLDVKMARGFPGGTPFPQNVSCPNQCKFCYEHNVMDKFPNIKTKYIPKYNEERFSQYVTQAVNTTALPEANIKGEPFDNFAQHEGQSYFFRKCDFFSLGLSHEQIELIVKNGAPLTAYTTGHNADPDFISYLCKTYPTKFNMNLSVITLDPEIRNEMMDSRLPIDDLKKICAIARNSYYFMLVFTRDQVISDVNILNDWSLKNNNSFRICRLYYSDTSPAEVIEYGKKADDCMAGVIDHFASNRNIYKDIDSRMTFSPDPPAYAWAARKELKALVKDCIDEESSMVICSKGAQEVLKTFFNQAKVVVPDSCFGGNIDISVSITLKGIAHELKKHLDKGIELKDVYLPNNIFLIEGKFDLNSQELSDIEKLFPALKFHVIVINKNPLTSDLSLDQCVDYYQHMIKTQPERFKEDTRLLFTR